MNNQTTQNQIDEHMKTLPRDVADAIRLSSWERKILNIGRKYGLHVDQLEVLQTELALAVLGLSGRDEFERETMHEAGISRATMSLIVADINHEIFEPIREHLQSTRIADSSLEGVTSTGLGQDEEDTLRRHGLTFGDEDEEEQGGMTPNVSPVSITSSVPNLARQESSTPQTSPVVQTPQTTQVSEAPQSSSSIFPASMSLRDILGDEAISLEAQVLVPEPNTQTKVQETTVKIESPRQDSAQETIKENPIPVSPAATPVLDPRSAQTIHHQKTINETPKENYQKSDPYREPIG